MVKIAKVWVNYVILPFLLLGVILDTSRRRGIPTSCALNSKTEEGVFLHENAIRFFRPLQENEPQ